MMIQKNSLSGLTKVSCPIFWGSNLKKIFVFLIASVMGYFLIPGTVLSGPYSFLGFVFIPFFALTITCLGKIIWTRVKIARSAGGSLLGIFAMVLGISTLQVCGLGLPSCGMAIGLGFGISLFPGFLAIIVRQHAVLLIGISITLQIISLLSMKCIRFKRLLSCK